MKKMLKPLALYTLVGSSLGLLSACDHFDSAQTDSVQNLGEQSLNPWFIDGHGSVQEKTQLMPLDHQGKAKNVILIVGDGMGISTVTAARILQGQKRGETGEENFLSFEKFPFSGLSKTYNTDQQTPDSAGTMTAMMTGVKTDAGVINLPEEVWRGKCPEPSGVQLTSALELAEIAGKSTGIVTTARITHATPAATYARSPERGWESDDKIPESEKQAGCEDIASQLIHFEERLKARYPDAKNIDGIEVMMGGGRRHFLPSSAEFNVELPVDRIEGKRQDGKHLIKEWQQTYPAGHYVSRTQELNNLDLTQVDKLLGLFHPSHMRYEIDRHNDELGEPSLKEMALSALQVLQKNDKGFFLMLEAGRIDHGHHAGNAYSALHDTIMLSDAVEAIKRSVNLEETLIIVTADHSHVFTIAGYPKRGNPILGKVIPPNKTEPELAADGLPYTTLGYMNGRGFADLGEVTYPNANKKIISTGRHDIHDVDTESPGYHQEALIPRKSETHGGEDVGIYAVGPGAHLVSGVNEQNVIFHIMRYAGGW